MRIQWARVLIAGFLIELALIVILIGGFAALGVSIEGSVPPSALVTIGVGCFGVAFLVTLWLGRGIQHRVVLHRFLIGLVATLLYLALVAGSGSMASALAAYGPIQFVVLNLLRIVGAILGGVVCEKKRSIRVKQSVQAT